MNFLFCAVLKGDVNLCYTVRFAMTIFSSIQRYNIITTLFSLIATLCCAMRVVLRNFSFMQHRTVLLSCLSF